MLQQESKAGKQMLCGSGKPVLTTIVGHCSRHGPVIIHVFGKESHVVMSQTIHQYWTKRYASKSHQYWTKRYASKSQFLITSKNLHLSIKNQLLVWSCSVVPHYIGQMSSPETLDLSINNLIGSIPNNVGNLSRLSYLDLSYNYLVGTIPREITHLVGLYVLSTSHNFFMSGSLPQEIGRLRNLTMFDISWCNLTGTIPISIGNITNMSRFDVSQNNLNGNIPHGIWQMDFKHLSLANNNFNCSITQSIFKSQNLQFLHLQESSLSGSMPKEFGMLGNLIDLDISNCNIIGSISISIEKLANISYLKLHNNQLFGHIPREMGIWSTLRNYIMKIIVFWLYLSRDRFSKTTS